MASFKRHTPHPFPCGTPHLASSRRAAYFSGWAYCFVHSFAVSIAAFSSSFQLFATSAARGSSGLGAPRSAWIESRIVLICRAGDQLSARDGPC